MGDMRLSTKRNWIEENKAVGLNQFAKLIKIGAAESNRKLQLFFLSILIFEEKMEKSQRRVKNEINFIRFG